MFKSLTYDVTFPLGRRLTNSIEFQTGFTAITGPNESGKSFIFEMLRYSLFGSIALRGISEDYRNLRCEAEFTIKGQDYKVVRTARNATLERGGEMLASGVTTVNQKVVEIMGFGIAVFDMACSINQGEIERLGTLTPTERKRLIDGVLGIDALDVVSRWAMEEARVLDREASSIPLNQPRQPSTPEGYTPSSSINMDELRKRAAELAEVKGFLSSPRPRPIKPTTVLPGLASLEPLAAEAKRMRQLKAQADALPKTAPVLAGNEEEQWAVYDAYQEVQRWLRLHPVPRYVMPNLIQFRRDWEAIRLSTKKAELVERIKQLKLAGSKPCPHCGEDVPLEQDAIERLQAEHDAIETYDAPRPPLSPTEIDHEERVIQAFDAETYKLYRDVPEAPEPSVKREHIALFKRQAEQVAERERLLAEYREMPDYESQLIERRAHDQALARYEIELASYEVWKMTCDLKRERLTALEGADQDLVRAQAQLQVAITYEAELARYQEALAIYTTNLAEVEKLKRQADEHRKVRDLMNTLRLMIKQHIMPSLNKVSSHLLSLMTGGQRNSIVVDEDFNVLVDGQRLDTLSGSGKSCANLALRIALGQVLTNRVFSVLMADEIDAAMDEFRADQTSKVLSTLETSISQILQISHKSIESVNQIDLGGHSERSSQDFTGAPA